MGCDAQLERTGGMSGGFFGEKCFGGRLEGGGGGGGLMALPYKDATDSVVKYWSSDYLIFAFAFVYCTM